MLSHLVRLPGPNPSSFAPPPPPAPAGLRSYYFIWVRTAVRLRHQASSCLPRCLVTTAQEKAAKCIRLLSALLYIYVFEPFVLFTKLQCITALTSVLRMYCKCSKERWKRTEMRHKALCLQRVSHARQESEWNTHKHTFLSNNTSLIAVHFRDLVRLRSHQQRTVPEFTWTEPQATLFKRTRVWFAGVHPRSEDGFTSSKRTELWRQSNPGAHQKRYCESALKHQQKASNA